MDQIIWIMLPPLVACLILTGIHTYLGLHVVSRGVIFVDLALAQIAALGSMFAFLLGFDPRSSSGYLYSLGFAFLGAAIFSLSRLRDKRIPQEALIGITFAVASSTAILIADRAPQGAEHVQEMLTGAILWVSWPTIWKTLMIYSAVGVFHVVFRRQFLLISMHPEEAERQGLAVRWWDFLFYMSFGFVITSSVAIAGILLVFSFLIIPSVIGMLFSAKIGVRLLIGWMSGTVVSLLGLYVSYRLDLPSGPAVVCSFGAVLILAALLRNVSIAENKGTALAKIGTAATVLALLLFLAIHFRSSTFGGLAGDAGQLEHVVQALQDLREGNASEQEAALEILRDDREVLRAGLEDGRIQPDQKALRRIGELGDARLIPVCKAMIAATKDPWVELYGAEALLRLGDKEGIHNLIALLGEPVPSFLKSRIIEDVREVVGEDFGYDPLKSLGENQKSINALEVWWHQNLDALTWDQERRSFSKESTAATSR